MVNTKNKEILYQILHDIEDFAKMKNIDCPPIYLLGGGLMQVLLNEQSEFSSNCSSAKAEPPYSYCD